MKTFFMKIFMVVAAGLCLFEGVVLIAIGLGRLAPEQFLSMYNSLMAAPQVLNVLLGVGGFFVVLGFILLVVSSRTKPAPKMIMAEKDGKPLGIPQQTIADFIHEIMEQNPYTSDITVEFVSGKETIEIVITSAFNGVSSLHQEISRIEKVLKNEIETVFGWNGFTINFQLRRVSVNSKRKYFSSNNSEKKETVEEKFESIVSVAEQKDEELVAVKVNTNGKRKLFEKDEGSDEEELKDDVEVEDGESDEPERKHKGKQKGSSVLSKMLWGK